MRAAIINKETRDPLISGLALRDFSKDRRMSEKIAGDNEFLLRFRRDFLRAVHAAVSAGIYITDDQQMAKDVVQDVLAGLWSRRHQMEFGKTIVHYLRKVTIHGSYNLIQQRRRREELLTQCASSKRSSQGEVLMVS